MNSAAWRLTVWFLGGVAIYSIIRTWGGIWWDAEIWQVVAAIGTWLLAGGVAFAFLQVKQARKSTNAQLAFNLFSTLRNPEIKKLLRDTIYALKPDETINLADEQKVAIDELIDWFDMLGSLVAEGIVDKKIAIESFAGPPALRCWYQLAPYIRQEDRDRGFYADNYEDFTRCSLEHFAKNKVRVMFHRKGEEESRKNLVVELQSYKKTKTGLYPRSLKEIKKARKKERV